MARLWVGGLEVGISERDLEDEVHRGFAPRQGLARTSKPSPRVHDHLCDAVWKIRKAQKCVGSPKGKTCRPVRCKRKRSLQ